MFLNSCGVYSNIKDNLKTKVLIFNDIKLKIKNKIVIKFGFIFTLIEFVILVRIAHQWCEIL